MNNFNEAFAALIRTEEFKLELYDPIRSVNCSDRLKAYYQGRYEASVNSLQFIKDMQRIWGNK